jgi:hypothetical protein
MVILNMIGWCILFAAYLGIGAAVSHMLTEDYLDQFITKRTLILARLCIVVAWPVVLAVGALVAAMVLTFKVIVQ